MAERTLIFIPTYNEHENVRPMSDQIVALGLDADVVFMDDGSPDGTGEILDGIAKVHPRISVIHRKGKLGIGGAHLDGLTYAYDHGYDKLVTMDCDFTHAPSDIPRLLALSGDHDLVVGSRYLQPDSLPGWSLVRKSLTNVGHALTVSMLGIGGDATGAFRVYRLRTIPRELVDLVRSRGYAFFFESLFVLNRNGMSIKDIPISLSARTYGHSKMSLGEIRRSVTQLLTLYLSERANPAQFRFTGTVNGVDPDLVDPQGWDEYWEKKKKRSTLVYELIASAYRNLIIKAHLGSAIRSTFPEGAHLIHAGCGSGQVDVDLHDHVKISAVDISVPALELYRRENPEAFEVRHASALALPYADATFDGAYNLGVVEHFQRPELVALLREMRRVVRPSGKILIFWPHAHATSVMVLDSIHWLMNDVMNKNTRLHPAEVSLVHNEGEARSILADAGLTLETYSFGPKDMFVQAIVVARPS